MQSAHTNTHTQTHTQHTRNTKTHTEREVLDACLRVLDGSGGGVTGGTGVTGVTDVLSPAVMLFALSCVEDDLAWFMAQEIIPAKVRSAHSLCVFACLLCDVWRMTWPGSWHRRSSLQRYVVLI